MEVSLPSDKQIQNWIDVEHMPIVETSPKIAPKAIYIWESTQSVVTDRPLEGPDFPMRDICLKVDEIYKQIHIIEDILREIYITRDSASVLSRYLTEHPTGGIEEVVHKMLESKLSLLNKMEHMLMTIPPFIGSLLGDKTIWLHGGYTDSFCDALCLLIYRVRALEILFFKKKGVQNGVALFPKYTKVTMEEANALSRIANEFVYPETITQAILGKLLDMSRNQELEVAMIDKIIQIMTYFLKDKMGGLDYILPEMAYAYVTTVHWMVKFYKTQRKYWKTIGKTVAKWKPKNVRFVQLLFETYNIVPLYMDCSFSPNIEWLRLMSEVPKSQARKAPKIEYLTGEQVYNLVQKSFKDLSSMISDAGFFVRLEDRKKTKEKKIASDLGREIVEKLPRVLWTVGKALSWVRETMADAIISVRCEGEGAEGQENLTPYDKVMRFGLKDQMGLFLLILRQCSSIRELLTDNIDAILKVVQDHISEYIQLFVWTVLPEIVARNSRATDVLKVMEKISLNMGDTRQLRQSLEGKEEKGVPVLNGLPTVGVPRVAGLEWLRTVLALLSNPESAHSLNDADVKAFRTFLKDTRFFRSLLFLGETLNNVADQSFLLFKECYLERDTLFPESPEGGRTSCVPVASSLPMLLANFALKHYVEAIYTNAIFCPLSIYNDAASVALRKLHSQFLYSEIKAEASICVSSIARNIADTMFHVLQRLVIIHSLPPPVILRNGSNARLAISPRRLGTILTQSTVSVLGSWIDTKDMISSRLNDIMTKEAIGYCGLIRTHGVLASVVVGKLMSLLRNTHQVLSSFGLPLTPFTKMKALAVGGYTETSFQSSVLADVIDHLTSRVVPDFLLLTCPYRLAPGRPLKLNLNVAEPVKRILVPLLEPSLSLLTTENFRELFWLIPDGSAHVIQQHLAASMTEALAHFLELYVGGNGRIGLRDALVAISPPPRTENLSHTFDTYQGTYGFFTDHEDVMQLFEAMGQIGNIIGLCSMMDTALLMKASGREQTGRFLGKKEDDKSPPYPFQKSIAEVMGSTDCFFENLLSEGQSSRPFTGVLLEDLREKFLPYKEFFEENSKDVTNCTSYTGFASRWSILDFVFTLLEIAKSQGKEHRGSIAEFGLGVYVCAGVIMSLTKQLPLFNAMSINSRIIQHKEVGFSDFPSSRLKMHVKISALLTLVMKNSMASFEQFLER